MTIGAQQIERETDRRFPVRVRIAVPAGGLGRQLAVMHAWLDAACGADGWGTSPAGFTGVVNDAVAFYLADTALARAFVNRFCCGYRAVEGGAAADPAPALRPTAAALPAPSGKAR